jgi:transcriptional regulator with XRE-family HTH domain
MPTITIKDNASERVARAIKERRERMGLTLRDLSAKSGISSSMISDVERAAKSPTIATVSALAEALGIPVSTLFESPRQRRGRIHVSRASKRSQIVDPGSGARRDGYRPALSTSKLEFVRYVVPARAQAGPFAAHAPGTIEHLLLAAGSIRVMFGSETALLRTGDCCTCMADAPHAFDNREGDVEALMYIVAEHP